MKALTFIIIFLTFTSFAFGQEGKKYPSKEEENYYKKRSAELPELINKEVILNFKSEGISIVNKSNFIPYNDSLHFTPYLDSIFSALRNNAGESYYDRKPDLIGRIDKVDILKREKKNNIEAFVYLSREFQNLEFGESSIWLAYSSDFGKSFNYYFTGLIQKQPVLVKWYSNEPLINVNNTLQIEGALLRQTQSAVHPGPAAKYECLKDGLSIVFDLNTLKKDSDGDGLTDILEKKFGSAPNRADTDNDGIPDNIDLNPIKNYPRTKRSILFEALLNEDINWNEVTIKTKDMLVRPKSAFTDSTETILIVTNDQELMGIIPQNYRIIFQTEIENQARKTPFNDELNQMHFTPLFKVDNKKNSYKIDVDFNTGGAKYLIIETKEGWRIKIISQWAA